MPHVDLGDPTAVLEFDLLPVDAPLVDRASVKTLALHNVCFEGRRTFVVKNVVPSRPDDWRCYDGSTGRVLFNSHYKESNPFDAPGSPIMQPEPAGADCTALDVSGMHAFGITKDRFSLYGRTAITVDGKPVFSVARRSKVLSMKLKRCFLVRREADAVAGDVLMHIVADGAANRLRFMNEANELVAVADRPPASVIRNVDAGAGCELQVTVAPGVDSSAVLAVLLALEQAPRNLVKRMLGNFVYAPLGADLAATDESFRSVNSFSTASTTAREQTKEKDALANSSVCDLPTLRHHIFGTPVAMTEAPKDAEKMVVAHVLTDVPNMPMELSVEPTEWLVAGPYLVKGAMQFVVYDWFGNDDEWVYGRGIIEGTDGVFSCKRVDGVFAWAGKQETVKGITRDMFIRRRPGCHYLWARFGCVPHAARPFSPDEDEEVTYYPWALTAPGWLCSVPAGTVGKCCLERKKAWVAYGGKTTNFDIHQGLTLYEVPDTAFD